MRGGRVPPSVLYAARLAGVTEILRLGGAYAAAAMAFGFRGFEPVALLSGPGGPWFTCAKMLLYLNGVVGVDLAAGPTELFIVADSSVPAEYVALDMLAQAEHSPLSQVILASTSSEYVARVEELISRFSSLAGTDGSAGVALESLSRNGLVVLVENVGEALSAAAEYAPEHLYLAVSPDSVEWRELSWVPAGAVGAGPWSPPALGDYTGGVNHVLPTGGAARWSGGLSPFSYSRFSYTYSFSEEGFVERAPPAARLARLEGFLFHALSLEARLRDLER
jgi:histidinol dehydrogenase